MKINDIYESTTAGAIATVAAPMTTQSRNASIYGGKKGGNLLTGKKTKAKYANSKVNESFDTKQKVIDYFVKQGKTAAQGASAWERGWRGPKSNSSNTPVANKPRVDHMAKYDLEEARLEEDDLIIVPGQGHKLKSGFIPHDQDRRDHEVEMAKSDLFQAAKNAKTVYELIADVSEDEGLDGWVQEKIIKANDYLNTIREYLEHKMLQNETGGVIAAGGVGEGLDEEGKGLWANIHAKRERIKKGSGERMRKPGSKGAPSAQDFKDAANEDAQMPEQFKKGQTVYLKNKTSLNSPHTGTVEQVGEKFVIIRCSNGRYKAKIENVTGDRNQSYLATKYGNQSGNQ